MFLWPSFIIVSQNKVESQFVVTATKARYLVGFHIALMGLCLVHNDFHKRFLINSRAHRWDKILFFQLQMHL